MEAAEKLLNRIYNRLNDTSDPLLANKIIAKLELEPLLDSDKYLADFKETFCTASISFQPLIQSLFDGLLANESIASLLEEIQKNDWISEAELDDAADYLNRLLHMICLFEAFVVTMANSYAFNSAVYDFIAEKRGVSNPGQPLNNLFFKPDNKKRSFFKNLKLVSVDPALLSGAFYRSLGDTDNPQEIKEKAAVFNKKLGLKQWNKVDPCVPYQKQGTYLELLALNILEALWEESDDKNHNKHAGAALIDILERTKPYNRYELHDCLLPRDSAVDAEGYYDLIPSLKINTDKKLVNAFHSDAKWNRLYNAWNLHFMLNHVDNEWVFIKLLIPSVLQAMPSHYMEVRVFALAALGNIWYSLSDKASLFPTRPKLQHAAEINRAFGIINDQVADECRKEQHLQRNPLASFQDILGSHHNWSFMMHLLKSITNLDNIHLTSAPAAPIA